MDNKDKIKVDSFILHNYPYSELDRVTHGSEAYYMGYCIVEYKEELYLADVLEEEIYTDEGSMYDLSGMGKHNSVGDITDELDIPWLREGGTDIQYRCIDNLRKIDQL